MRLTRQILTLLTGASIVLGCGADPAEGILGQWQDMQGFQTVEFRADGTTRWMDQDTLDGSYTFTQSDSLSIRWEVSGSDAMQPSRFAVTLRGETLVLRATNGAVLRYQKTR